MKGKKLVIAVILALIVCLVLIPTCAFADGEQSVQQSAAGEGGSDNGAGNTTPGDNGAGDTTPGDKEAADPASGDNSSNDQSVDGDDTKVEETIVEETKGNETEESKVVEEGTSGGENVPLQPESGSSFKVILSYGDKSVELNDLKGGEQNDLAAIVSQLGIEGDIESAKSDAEELFYAADGKLVTSKAFGTKQTLTLVVGGVEYTIDVEDDRTVNTIKELVNAVKNCDGGTIKIGADMVFNDEDGVVIPEGKTVTIDLNGKKLSLNRGDGKTIILNNGTLTIKDSSSKGTGLIESKTGGLNPVSNMPGATLIIDGGTIRAINSGGRTALDNRGIATINDGAKLEREGNPGVDCPSAIINYVNDGAVLTINGGTVTGDISARGTIIIKSGTLNGKILSVNRDKVTYDPYVTISGGTFSKRPNDAHLAKGATLVANSDETYSVIMPEPKPAEESKTAASAPLYAKYFVIEGKGQQWTAGDIEFVLNSKDVVKVLIDGAEVEFTVAEDGTVTIAAAVIEALEAGTHEIEFIFADGSCKTTFTVK